MRFISLNLFVVLMLCMLPVFSQFNQDSLRQIRRQLKIVKNSVFDSIESNNSANLIEAKIDSFRMIANNYYGFFFGVEASTIDYRGLTSDMVTAGFSPFPKQIKSFGLGVLGKYDHIMFDVTILAQFKGNEQINKVDTVIADNFWKFSMNAGYTLMPERRSQVYLFGGLAYGQVGVTYKGPFATATMPLLGGTQFSNYIYLNSTRLYGTLGVGANLALHKGPRPGSGAFLVIRGNTSLPFWQERLTNPGIPYTQDIRTGRFVLSLGLLFCPYS